MTWEPWKVSTRSNCEIEQFWALFSHIERWRSSLAWRVLEELIVRTAIEFKHESHRALSDASAVLRMTSGDLDIQLSDMRR